MTESFWADKYPEGIPDTIDPDAFRNILAVLRVSCERFAQKTAFSSLGGTLSYAELARDSSRFAAFLQQQTSLQPGDRIAIQLPNLIQYPVAVFGALKAGLIVVNTNPLYTVPEMRHQFRDAGVRAVVCLANGADRIEAVLPDTDIRHVIITEIGDALPAPRRWLVNAAVRHVKRLVPAYRLPEAIAWRDALAAGNPDSLQMAEPAAEDVAILQYTGGTTGIAKGAMLTHRNLVANMLQCRAMLGSLLDEEGGIMVAPLPLYHIYAFTLHCMTMVLLGANNLLILNPRDIPATVKALQGVRFSGFVGLNTLFATLCGNREFRALDFSALRLTLAGGMALQASTGERWQAVTGCSVAEGYGLTETSPVVAVNPVQKIEPGTIGIPVPSTECRVVDDQGQVLPLGEQGELCVRGPQVMAGYWQRPEATAEILDADGWLHTGDIAIIQPDGYLRIVDRKKDMILVSGFNVYPNELEEVLAALPGVLHCAAIGVPDERTGEAVKVFVVPDPQAGLTERAVLDYLHERLTGYKRPRHVEFRDSLPMTNVGKILRRVLRDEVLAEGKH